MAGEQYDVANSQMLQNVQRSALSQGFTFISNSKYKQWQVHCGALCCPDQQCCVNWKCSDCYSAFNSYSKLKWQFRAMSLDRMLIACMQGRASFLYTMQRGLLHIFCIFLHLQDLKCSIQTGSLTHEEEVQLTRQRGSVCQCGGV